MTGWGQLNNLEQGVRASNLINNFKAIPISGPRAENTQVQMWWPERLYFRRLSAQLRQDCSAYIRTLVGTAGTPRG